MDWVTPKYTLDIKTFQEKRDMTIERTIANAIWYESYHSKMWLYTHLRELRGEKRTTPVLAFVESQPPHEVRFRSLGPKAQGMSMIYWTRAAADVNRLLECYSYCMRHFGERPWREPQEIEMLIDEELPGLAYGN